MRKALIALVVCSVMVGAFTMTSVASASHIVKLGDTPGSHGIINTKNPHLVVHIDTKDGPLNINSNNPNGPHPAP